MQRYATRLPRVFERRQMQDQTGVECADEEQVDEAFLQDGVGHDSIGVGRG